MINLASGKKSQHYQQGSVLRPLFFNIFVIISFTGTTALCNNADDNNTYSSDENANIVINRLRKLMKTTWFLT